MTEEYKSKDARKFDSLNGEAESLESLERKVLRGDGASSEISQFKQAENDLIELENEMRNMQGVIESPIGKLFSRVLPTKTIASYYVTKLGNYRSDLEGYINRNRRQAEKISQKIADAQEAKGYAGILIERYDLMTEDLGTTREGMKEELAKARETAARNPNDSKYREYELEARAIDSDLRDIKGKQNWAAQKVVAYDKTTGIYDGLLAIVNKTVNKAEQAYLAADLKIRELKVLIETGGIASTKSLMTTIRESIGTGVTVSGISGNFKDAYYGAFKVLDGVNLDINTNGKAKNGLEESVRKSVASENDGYLDQARKILERDRTATPYN